MSRILWIALLTWGFTASATRLVSTSPQVTEILFQLGKSQDLAATVFGSDFPPEAKKIPLLGQMLGVGAEKLAKFAPNWVISDPLSSSSLVERAALSLNMGYFTFQIKSVDDLLDETDRFLKTVYGEGPSPLAEKWRKQLPRSSGKGHTFLLFAWSNPTILFGHSTFLSDLLSRTGGVNALPSKWTHPYPQVTREWLLRRDVDVIYFMKDDTSTAEPYEKLAAQLWPRKKVRVVGLPSDHFARASFTPFEHLAEIGGKHVR